MATASLISEKQIQDFIIPAVSDVCAMILKQDAGFVEKSAEAAYAGFAEKPHVFGSVGFIGDIDGVIYLCIPDDFAHEAVGLALGMTPDEVKQSGDDTVKDVIGEITNMIVGGFKNALCKVGFPCRLTLPAIVRGDDLTVASLKDAERHIFHFDCAGHRLIADIQLKLE